MIVVWGSWDLGVIPKNKDCFGICIHIHIHILLKMYGFLKYVVLCFGDQKLEIVLTLFWIIVFTILALSLYKILENMKQTINNHTEVTVDTNSNH